MQKQGSKPFVMPRRFELAPSPEGADKAGVAATFVNELGVHIVLNQQLQPAVLNSDFSFEAYDSDKDYSRPAFLDEFPPLDLPNTPRFSLPFFIGNSSSIDGIISLIKKSAQLPTAKLLMY